jgi:hypothetical protein
MVNKAFPIQADHDSSAIVLAPGKNGVKELLLMAIVAAAK